MSRDDIESRLNTEDKSEELNYLENKQRILKLKQEKGYRSISPEGRLFLNKTLNDKVNPHRWNKEYREHIIYQVVFKLISPFPPSRFKLARSLNLHPKTLQKVLNLPEYHRIKNDLRKELRSKWGANIDMVVVKKAMTGSKYHAELFYKLQGELIDKSEVVHKDAIPEKAEDRKAAIEKYLDELGINR